jgi:site-specific DNA recombinase
MNVAFYARVSSEQQAQAGTIDSQVAGLRERIKNDGYTILKENEFIDDGYSGSVLTRPALERLRDSAASHLLDKLYVHAPDRLARKYAYQYLLMEEFSRFGIEIVFMTNQPGNDPESELLLQVQGIISEYERTKIMERSRRGKLHAAKQGSPSVLSSAPYGYRYIAKRDNGAVIYEINEKEAVVIRQLFSWVGQERMSINAATKRLTEMRFSTPHGKERWNRGSVHRMLKNPAYKGTAAFGKTKCVPKKSRLRAYKGQSLQSKSVCSVERKEKEEWILIPVPAIIDESLFETVQAQLEENKRLKRQRMTGVRYLLQGLVVCNLCGYGFCGNTATGYRKHNYYSCGGTRVYTNRDRRCDTPSVHANILENIVWEEVKNLLKNPHYLEKEYRRRIKELENNSNKNECDKLNAEKIKLENCISRLIDSYTDSLIEKAEFEPRIKSYKKKLFILEQKIFELISSEIQQVDLQMLIGKLETFSITVKQKLENVAWQDKRNIFEALIKQVEIGRENVNIIFRVSPYPSRNNSANLLEDCRMSANTRISDFHDLSR